MADQHLSSAGGAASASGNDYQNQVGAWLAVRILAEHGAPLPWGLADANGSLEFLRCQTEQPVDDLLVGTSSGGFAFIQAKTTVNLSADSNSELGSAIAQFVRQYIANASHKNGEGRPWERPLDPSKDRLVLVTTSNASS